MKRNVRLFSLLLALMCVVSMLPAMVVSAETPAPVASVDLSEYADGATYTAPDGTTYKVIKSYDMISQNSGALNANYILGANIQFPATGWKPINLNGRILDGNGYAIYGVNYSAASGIYLVMGAGSATNVMRNLSVGTPENKIQLNATKENQVTGLVGDVKNNETFVFENVSFYATIQANKNVAGGFVGLLRKGTLKFDGCNFYGSIDNGAVTTNNPVGGFIGGVQDRAGKCVVTIENCKNYASVSGYTLCGGYIGDVISGYTATAHEVSITFRNSENEGVVSTNATNRQIGGFIGQVHGTNGNGNITLAFSDSVNRGNITGKQYAAGFIGSLQPAKATDKFTTTFTNCANKGDVSGTYIGGFVGVCRSSATDTKYTSTVTLQGCVNEGSVNGNCAGGFVGYQKDDSAPNALDKTTSKVSVADSLNLGTIQGTEKASGIVGCVDQQYCSTTITNTVNLGKIAGTKSGVFAAGITMRNISGLTVTDCGSFGEVTAVSGGKMGVLTADFGWNALKVENLHYIAFDGALDLEKIGGYKGKTIVESFEDGIAYTNELLGEKLGKVILNNAGTGAVLATPTFAGVQESKTTAGTIRLVATLNDSLNYSAVGFKVTLVGGQSVVTETNEVYNVLTSTNDQGFASEISAAELYGTYIYALAIKNIPTEGTVTLQVTPYGIDFNDTEVEYVGNTYEIVYTNGHVVDVRSAA